MARCDRPGRRAVFETLEARRPLSANPVISEFVASNDSTLEDGFGEDPDWIEIYNAGDETVDLVGYHLTDKPAQLDKWTFSESTPLPPNSYLVVFASGKDTRDPNGALHTNFKLSATGEYLALTAPDTSVVSQIGNQQADYPSQFNNGAYGQAGFPLVTESSHAMYWVPTTDAYDPAWHHVEFDALAAGFQSGKAAIGYESQLRSETSYESLIETELPRRTRAVFVRTEFDIPNAASVPDLTLEMLLDDGVVVYLNGTQVYTDQKSEPSWDSVSDAPQLDDNVVLRGINIDLNEHVGLLRDGKNVIAFHLINYRPTSSDLLLVPRLWASLPTGETGYLLNATPGRANAMPWTPGPVIRTATVTPAPAATDEPIVITAAVSSTLDAVNPSTVELHYRVMYGATERLRMLDDGEDADAIANDGIYTAEIPSQIANVGEMIRWYVTAEDTQQRMTREPRFEHKLDSAEYFGTIIPDPTTCR